MTEMGFGGAPLVVGAVRGIRGFDLDCGKLHPIAYRGEYVWTPGENIAWCGGWRHETRPGRPWEPWYVGMLGGSEPLPVAHPACQCGFYAYYSRNGSHVRGVAVKGIIEGYGSVTLGTLGFRCSKARIVALAYPHPPSIWPSFVLCALSLKLAYMGYQKGAPDWVTIILTLINGIAIGLLGLSLLFRFVGHNVYREMHLQKKLLKENYPGIPIYQSVEYMRLRHLRPYLKKTKQLLDDDGAHEFG